MAEVKISQLPAAGPLDGTELIEVVQNGVSHAVAVSQIISRGSVVYAVLLPGGGTVENPGIIEAGQRYSITNPLPGKEIIAMRLEIFWNGGQSNPESFTLFTGSVDYTRGARVNHYLSATQDEIVVQVGRTAVLGQSDASCNAFNAPRGTDVQSAPAIVKMWVFDPGS